ncbi:hypothetical protein, partial [Klebsiella pneumoniae]|uniref:hypothetical protein n=1 Tax=Klebsiella pneumoniae TaxID=573 RepID=UPI001C6F7A2D
LKMPAFEWVHVQLHQQKGMISLSPPTICNSAIIWMISVTGLLFGRITLRSWLVSLWFDPHVILPGQQV